MKPCVKCGSTDRNASGKCRPCMKRFAANWRAANLEQDKNNKTQYKKNNPNKIRELRTNYNKTHLDIVNCRKIKWRRANPEKVAKIKANSAKVNPGAIKARKHNRRARKAGNGGTHTNKQWLELLASYHGLCAYCLHPATTRDHIISISKGGTNNIENVVPACGFCNISKGTKPLLKWLVWKG